MSTKIYRLLRNNKEQGPFTSDELIGIGLKPYDLVWVDGRSAAWSYPGELPEFKLYMPTPEEQPFDSFLKKESSSSVSSSVQAAVAINDITIQSSAKQPKPRYKISAAWSRIQTITVPLNREKMVTATTAQPSTKTTGSDIAFQSKPLNWEDAWRDWEKEKDEDKSMPSPAVTQPVLHAQKQTINEIFANAPVLETRYSEPLDSLKDKYIENILGQKRKSGTSFSLGRLSELIIPCIALFVIFSIGYWLLHDNKTASALSSAPLTAQPVASKPANELPSTFNTGTDNSHNTEIITAKQVEETDKTVAVKPHITSKTEPTKNHAQTLNLNVPATKNAVASKKINDAKNSGDAKIAVTASDNKTLVKKEVSTNTKQFDPAVINNVPKDNAYNDKASGSTGDLNAAENRPVRRRTNGDEVTGEEPNLNEQSLNNQPTVSKRSNGKANVKYVNVPQYVEMNNGTGAVKIENVSDVDLDLVVVDVQYYDASSRFRKGETLYLHNLKAGKTVVVKTPRDVNSMYAVSKVSLVSADSKGVYIVGDN